MSRTDASFLGILEDTSSLKLSIFDSRSDFTLTSSGLPISGFGDDSDSQKNVSDFSSSHPSHRFSMNEEGRPPFKLPKLLRSPTSILFNRMKLVSHWSPDPPANSTHKVLGNPIL